MPSQLLSRIQDKPLNMGRGKDFFTKKVDGETAPLIVGQMHTFRVG